MRGPKRHGFLVVTSWKTRNRTVPLCVASGGLARSITGMALTFCLPGPVRAATLDSVDEVEARGWLDGDIPVPPSGMDVTHRLSPLNRRLRMESLAGAEADSRRRLGRGLTAEELERVLWHYPGDIGTRGLRP